MGATAAEKAALVREYSERAVRNEMENVPPDVPYTVVELVGKGSFGSVFKGIHNDTKQVVAVKSMDLDQADDEIKDIQKEIGLLSELTAGDAPNITAFHGSYLLGQRLWIIMDLCQGGSMRTLMKSGPIEEKFISIVVRETLAALGYLHKNGIIHRDIKAANILVSHEGRVQLCDFGVSAQLTGKAGKRSTFVGTPQWMAPEALTGGLYDSKIDIWSFGITIIEMAKQNPPLHHVQPHRVVDMIPRLPPPRLEGGTWSNALREFVALCLNEIPEDRCSVEELQRSKFVKAAKLPTIVMRELMARYEIWEKGGGVRGSMLYMGMHDGGPGDTVTSDPGWDFDTIKSRISGVPAEWEMGGMGSRNATIKAPYKPPILGAVRGQTPEKLLELFESPEQRQKREIYGASGLHNSDRNGVGPSDSTSSLNIISIPEFDDDGIQLPSDNTPSSLMGQIVIPSLDDDIMSMPKPQPLASTAGAIITPPPATAPSGPIPERPTITRTRMNRADSAGASILRRPEELPGSPNSVREDRGKDVSPARFNIPASAPSSPPRATNLPQAPMNQMMQGTANGVKPQHIASKSVPTFGGVLRADGSSAAPPVPSIGNPPKTRSAENTPHHKSRSQDITGRPLQRFRNNGVRPSNLNLGPPNNSNFNSGILPPSPSRPVYHSHTPQHSLSSVQGIGLSGISSASSSTIGPGPALSNMGSLEFPSIQPLNVEVLTLPNGYTAVTNELDRILGGLGDALEVMEVGLKKLHKKRQQLVAPEDEE